MARIKIGEVILENVNITNSTTLLGLNYVTTMTLFEISGMYNRKVCPEIQLLNDDNTPYAIYLNHNLISVSMDTIGNKRVVNVTLQVSPSEIDEKEILNNQIATQAIEIDKLKTSLIATEDKINSTTTRVEETENKVISIEGNIAIATTIAENASEKADNAANALTAIEEGIINA